MLYKTAVHSSRLGAMRLDERRKAVRGKVTDDHLIIQMGYATLPLDAAESLTIVKITQDLG